MKTFNDLISIVKKLRSPEGCPWDRKQTHDSLLPFLFEESNEVADTIISGDYTHLKEELGDLLLHILLHSEIAEENSEFTLENVINDIAEKLIRRHPHVFGTETAETAEDVNKIWEDVKKNERKDIKLETVLDKVPNHFPPLLKSYKYQKEAGKLGFDWDNYEDVIKKVQEELDETIEAINSKMPEYIEHEIGDLIFSAVNLARFFDISADLALTKCNKRFYERFRLVELQVLLTGKTFKDFSLTELDGFWSEAKVLLMTHTFDRSCELLKTKHNESQL